MKFIAMSMILLGMILGGVPCYYIGKMRGKSKGGVRNDC